ncbi:MAG: hypothetical protein J7559_02230 [Cohnella sp.]|nr:hypothetical protein [Cohnella sp.]
MPSNREVSPLSRLMKLVLLIAGVVLVDVISLSPGLLGASIGGGSILETAFGVTLLVMSPIVLLYGSYALLLKPPVTATVRGLATQEDFIEALRRYRSIKALKPDIAQAIDQIERLEKKKQSLFDLLARKFDPNELSYKRFSGVIHEVNRLFYQYVRGIVSRLNVFDATEYDKFAGTQKKPSWLSGKLLQERAALYQEYVAYITGSIGANEEILLKLDKLLLEISRLDSTDYKAIEAMPGMREIDALIQQTKFYKQ